MPSLLIKDLSAAAHKHLRDQAKSHHRSMQKEAALLLNTMLGAEPIEAFAERFKMENAPRARELSKAVTEGRR